MDLKLKDKVIIVTGGAKGIGLGIVEILAQEGAIPVIIGRKKADNQKEVDRIKNSGYQVFSVEAELTNPTECEQAVKSVIKEFGRIEGIVNNAGLNDGVGLENGTYEGFMDSLHRNLVHY